MNWWIVLILAVIIQPLVWLVGGIIITWLSGETLDDN